MLTTSPRRAGAAGCWTPGGSPAGEFSEETQAAFRVTVQTGPPPAPRKTAGEPTVRGPGCSDASFLPWAEGKALCPVVWAASPHPMWAATLPCSHGHFLFGYTSGPVLPWAGLSLLTCESTPDPKPLSAS